MKKQSELAGVSGGRERRGLKLNEWPEADRLVWEAACRPSSLLKKGGSASHLNSVSKADIARRYGLFLGFLKLNGLLDPDAPPAGQVTPTNVQAYMADLAARVSSVTAWNSIYKLRRAAQLIAPSVDFSWLVEIEGDLAFVMEPRSKLDKLVFAERIVEAGLALIAEAKQFARADFVRARGNPKRSHAGTSRALPKSSQEFCHPGNRADVQTDPWQVVDHPACRQHKNPPAAGGTTNRGMAQPLY